MGRLTCMGVTAGRAVTALAVAMLGIGLVCGSLDAAAAAEPLDVVRDKETGAAEATTAPEFPWSAPAGARVTEEGWFAPVERGYDLPATPTPVTRAFVIPVEGAITDTMAEAIERKVIRCKTSAAELVIFRLDTPGGASAAMDHIVDLILQELSDVRTVAFVDPEAFSAGAIIALACNEIVMVPTAVIGDAMPIMIGPQGMLVEIPEKERGKFESAMRGEVRVLAGRNGYNLALCEAMVTITHELWLIRHRDRGELRVVEAGEWRHRVAGAPPTTQSVVVAPADAEWEYLRTLDGPNELVTLTATEARFVGLAAEVVDDLPALEARYGVAAPPTVLEDNWSERLVTFLTTPAVVGVLFFAGLICVYVETHTPGFGLAGGVAIFCFAVLFGSRYLVGLAAWWEVALFVVGLVLLALEVFIIPGFGIAGIAGILACVVALLAMFVPNDPLSLPIPTTELDWSLLGKGVLALCVAFLAAVIAIVVLARYLPKVPVAGRLVLVRPGEKSTPPTSETSPIRTIQPGQTGVVTATCRPAGVARFGETLIDVVAEGGYIKPGTRVVVLKNEGNRLVVAPLS